MLGKHLPYTASGHGAELAFIWSRVPAYLTNGGVIFTLLFTPGFVSSNSCEHFLLIGGSNLFDSYCYHRLQFTIEQVAPSGRRVEESAETEPYSVP